MKTSLQFILGLSVVLAASSLPVPAPQADPDPDPGRQLRVPRIYNALIRSDAKLQPSRAYPYSTPVFQPVGLGPVPGAFSPLDGDLLDAWNPQELQAQGFPQQGLIAQQQGPPSQGLSQQGSQYQGPPQEPQVSQGPSPQAPQGPPQQVPQYQGPPQGPPQQVPQYQGPPQGPPQQVPQYQGPPQGPSPQGLQYQGLPLQDPLYQGLPQGPFQGPQYQGPPQGPPQQAPQYQGPPQGPPQPIQPPQGPPAPGPTPQDYQPQDVQTNNEQEAESKPKPEAPAPPPADSPKKDVEQLKPTAQKEKTNYPLTFYPRSLGYYHPHPFIPYSYPLGPQPFVFGGPLGYNDHLYQYPNFGYDGYFGGGVFPGGIERVGGGFRPAKEVEPARAPIDVKKTEEPELLKDEAPLRKPADSIGIRELEFLSDEEPSQETERSPDDRVDNEKDTDISQAS